MFVSYGVSRVGTSHEKIGAPCQDYNIHHITADGTAIGIIADGVGNSPLSQIGSKLAAETAMKTIVRAFEEKARTFDEYIAILQLAFERSRLEIIAMAENNGKSTTLYETTLTAVIVSDEYIACGHCGDGGAVVLDADGNVRSITVQINGMYAGQVFSLVSHPERWLFGMTKMRSSGVILATDGMYDYFNRIDENSRAQYLFGYLTPCYASADNDALALQKSLSRHICSTEITDIVDDDRTVLVICNKGCVIPPSLKWCDPIVVTDKPFDPSLRLSRKESQQNAKKGNPSSPQNTKSSGKAAKLIISLCIAAVIIALAVWGLMKFLQTPPQDSQSEPSVSQSTPLVSQSAQQEE